MPPTQPYRSSTTPGAGFHHRDARGGENNPAAEPVVPDDIVRRYIKVVRPGRRPGAWYHQARYGFPFRAGERRLALQDVRGVLSHHRHVAVRAPRSRLTDYIAFDIDCKAGDIAQRDARYWGIRRLLGVERVPLVYATPSGAGLRVRYRIPLTPLDHLVAGRQTGLVADVLRAAGLPVLDGSIEIFPQCGQADRLPLGSNMPLLDPDTLEMLPDAAISTAFDEAMLRGALERMERWHAMPYGDLVPYLESLPGEPLMRVVTKNAGCGEDFVRDGSRVLPSDATLRFVHDGLAEPSSRFRSEYRVALAGVLAPAVLSPFGLVDANDDENVAESVARWLSQRHNGMSKEWLQSLRCTSPDGAIAKWTDRYLKRSATTGDHFIDRVRAAAGRLDGSLRHTLLITDDERRELVQLAEAAGLSGSSLYRAEVWLAAWRRAVKSIIRHHLRRGVPLDEVDDIGGRFVLASIAARWMERWPYGRGARGRGSAASIANYVLYRQILIDARWMRLARFSPTAAAFRRGMRPPDGIAFEANVYAVRVPRMDVRVRDVGIDALELRKALQTSGLTMSGRPVGIDEAHHILWLSRADIPARRRYGYRLGVRLEQIARALGERLAVGPGAAQLSTLAV